MLWASKNQRTGPGELLCSEKGSLHLCTGLDISSGQLLPQGTACGSHGALNGKDSPSGEGGGWGGMKEAVLAVLRLGTACLFGQTLTPVGHWVPAESNCPEHSMYAKSIFVN